MKRLYPFSAPLGIMIWLTYKMMNRYVIDIPDKIANPIMIISVLFMMIGIIYNGWCIGKGKHPFKDSDNKKSKDM